MVVLKAVVEIYIHGLYSLCLGMFDLFSFLSGYGMVIEWVIDVHLCVQKAKIYLCHVI